MSTAPSPAPNTTDTQPPRQLLCYFLNRTHSRQFDAGRPALTLCGEWVSRNDRNAPHNIRDGIKAEQIPCPRCMNIKFSQEN